MTIVRAYYPDHTEEELDLLKHKDFTPWLQYYVSVYGRIYIYTYAELIIIFILIIFY